MRAKLIAALVSFGFLATASPALACPYEESEKTVETQKIVKKDVKKVKKAPSKKAQARRAAAKRAKARPAKVATK